MLLCCILFGYRETKKKQLKQSHFYYWLFSFGLPRKYGTFLDSLSLYRFFGVSNQDL